MRTRTLGVGDRALTVGEIALGTWGLSGDGYGPVEPGQARATIEAALDEGCTLLETASCYGEDGAIENTIGEVLSSRSRENVQVLTRVGVLRPGVGPARKNFHPKALRAGCEMSLKRLRAQCIDAFVLHNPMPSTLKGTEWFEAMASLREQGKVRLIGVSVGSAVAARLALAQDIDVISLPYNLLYPRLLNDLASDLSAKKITVVAHSALAYGLLVGTWSASRIFDPGDHRADRWNPTELARRIRQREALRFLVRPPVKDLREAALRFVLSNKLVACVAVGARTPEQARENAHAADELPFLDEDSFSSLGKRLAEEGIAM